MSKIYLRAVLPTDVQPPIAIDITDVDITGTLRPVLDVQNVRNDGTVDRVTVWNPLKVECAEPDKLIEAVRSDDPVDVYIIMVNGNKLTEVWRLVKASISDDLVISYSYAEVRFYKADSNLDVVREMIEMSKLEVPTAEIANLANSIDELVERIPESEQTARRIAIPLVWRLFEYTIRSRAPFSFSTGFQGFTIVLNFGGFNSAYPWDDSKLANIDNERSFIADAACFCWGSISTMIAAMSHNKQVKFIDVVGIKTNDATRSISISLKVG